VKCYAFINMRSAVFLKTMGYALILLPFSGSKIGSFVGERIKPFAAQE